MEESTRADGDFLSRNDNLRDELKMLYVHNRYARRYFNTLVKMARESDSPSAAAYLEAMGNAGDLMAEIEELEKEVHRRHEEATVVIETPVEKE